MIATRPQPKRSCSWRATETYPSLLSFPESTSVPAARMPNTSAASASFAMHTSTNGTSFAIVSPACSRVQSFLRKLRSQETVMPFALAALQASRQAAGMSPPRAGVMPVKWNQPAPSRILSQSKSARFARAMEEPALS